MGEGGEGREYVSDPGGGGRRTRGQALTFVLVKGQEDDRAVVVELRLVEKRDEPEVEPVADKVDRGVVAL